MVGQNHAEDNLIAVTSYGNFYRLTVILNTLEPQDFKAISDRTYKKIIDILAEDFTQQGNHATCAALNVFVEKTEKFLPHAIKEQANCMLHKFHQTQM